MKPTHLSLFSGIGGLDLAAERAGFQTVGQCEWADYPTKVLEKHWPDVPRWRDIRTLTKESFYEQTGLRTVDIISGGFPCQPFSVAGKRRGSEDDRYLWPEMLRVIEELGPAWIVGENVAGLVSMALDQVLSDLENKGYEARTFIIPACGVDAPHRRDRCAIVAWNHDSSTDRRKSQPAVARAEKGQDAKPGGICNDVADGYGIGLEMQGAEQPPAGAPGGGEDVAHTSIANGEGCIKFGEEEGRPQSSDSRFDIPDATSWGLQEPERESGEQGQRRRSPAKFTLASCEGWWPVEPDVGRVAHGVPSRVDRLKCLGNAVVPAQFYPVFQAIFDTSLRGGNPDGED